jgi:hypothetical protein
MTRGARGAVLARESRNSITASGQQYRCQDESKKQIHSTPRIHLIASLVVPVVVHWFPLFISAESRTIIGAGSEARSGRRHKYVIQITFSETMSGAHDCGIVHNGCHHGWKSTFEKRSEGWGIRAKTKAKAKLLEKRVHGQIVAQQFTPDAGSFLVARDLD